MIWRLALLAFAVAAAVFEAQDAAQTTRDPMGGGATVVAPAPLLAPDGGSAAGAGGLVQRNSGAPVLVGAGDIASCGNSGDEATALLLDAVAGTVFTAGDNAYDAGSATEFADCYDPSWGRHKARTRPSAGNHEYGTVGAAGHFGYFRAAAGETGKGYYSYDLGAWHVVVINSNCSQVGGCGAGSAQEQWLRADLAAHPTACTAAYWHHPLFSSGPHGNIASMRPIWQALYDYGADVIISGHDHDYERFAPQDPNGVADATRGIRQFVVGTGGRSHYSFTTIRANSEVRNSDTYGVLKLTLHPTSYDWEFIPQAGMSFTDSGSAACPSSVDSDGDGCANGEEVGIPPAGSFRGDPLNGLDFHGAAAAEALLVDASDVSAVTAHFGEYAGPPPSPNWDPKYDLWPANEGAVDGSDISAVTGQFGKYCVG